MTSHEIVYEYIADVNKYDSYIVSDEKDYFVDDSFGKSRLADTWTPFRIECDRRLRRTDFPGLPGGAPVVNARALAVLKPVLGASVEPLPLLCDDGPMFALNVLDNVDCLDLDASDVLMSPSDSSKILMVDEYVFKPGAIGTRYMFRIKGMTAGVSVFVTSLFRDVVEKNGLVGLLFKPLS
jgi:hypothetical protein